MRYVEFGQARQKSSQIMLGLMRIDKMSAAEVGDFIRGALDLGVNALDIADVYGLGKCEELLGEVFAGSPGLRNSFFLQSKTGIRKDPDLTWFDFSREHILEGVDAILSRLKTDHLDSLLLHRPDALMEPQEIAEAFLKLYREGKVLDFGVSNFNPIMMDTLQQYVNFPIATNQVQLSCAFTPAFDAGFWVNTQHEHGVMRDGGVFEYCRHNEIVIQAWSVMQYGYFEGVFLNSPKYAALNAKLKEIADIYHTTPTAVAMAWILRYPARMQAVIGTTKLERVRESAAACEFELTRRQWYEIYAAAGNTLP